MSAADDLRRILRCQALAALLVDLGRAVLGAPADDDGDGGDEGPGDPPQLASAYAPTATWPTSTPPRDPLRASRRDDEDDDFDGPAELRRRRSRPPMPVYVRSARVARLRRARARGGRRRR